MVSGRIQEVTKRCNISYFFSNLPCFEESSQHLLSPHFSKRCLRALLLDAILGERKPYASACAQENERAQKALLHLPHLARQRRQLIAQKYRYKATLRCLDAPDGRLAH